MGITMKNVLLSVFVCFAFAKAELATAQNYKQHVVEHGETVWSIVQKYDITSEQLLELNPDMKLGLKTGSTLILPANAAVLTQARIVDYKVHNAARKETLYAIAKEYGVTVLDIKEANKELYSRELTRGEKLKIPVFELNTSIASNGVSMVNSKDSYEVQPKDTKFGIAKKYNITVAVLDALNPGIENIQPGMLLKVVPDLKDKDAEPVATVTRNFIAYKVPAQMTMYSLENTTGLSEEAITVLNPSLKDGLKAGMVLKLPNTAFKQAAAASPNPPFSFVKPASGAMFKEQRIAVLLPFSLEKIDTVATDLKRLKKDLAMRVATDFYSGAVVARDSALRLGIAVKLDIYDTRKTVTRIDSLIATNDFTQYQTIIGPLLSKNVDRLALKLADKKIPIIAPMTNSDMDLYPNVFQARPDEKLLRKKLFDYLKQYASGKHVIIISDNKNPSLKNEFRAAFPGAVLIVPNTSNYIYKKDYLEALIASGENVVILAAKDPGLVDDTLVSYGKKGLEFNIRIFAYENFDDLFIPKADLAATGFTFPSINHYQGTDNSFYTVYKKTYGKTPNEYAVRGFDVTLDAILRQHAVNGIYDPEQLQKQRIFVENPIKYVKKPNGKGYQNSSFFLLQYTKSQTLKRID